MEGLIFGILQYVNMKQAKSQWRPCVTHIITTYFSHIFRCNIS